MVRTRKVSDIPESSQQRGNEPPTLAEALAALIAARAEESELLRQIAQNTSRAGGRNGHQQEQPRTCSYSDFLATHPPTFERAKEPLDVDHWIRVI